MYERKGRGECFFSFQLPLLNYLKLGFVFVYPREVANTNPKH